MEAATVTGLGDWWFSLRNGTSNNGIEQAQALAWPHSQDRLLLTLQGCWRQMWNSHLVFSWINSNRRSLMGPCETDLVFPVRGTRMLGTPGCVHRVYRGPGMKMGTDLL